MAVFMSNCPVRVVLSLCTCPAEGNRPPEQSFIAGHGML